MGFAVGDLKALVGGTIFALASYNMPPCVKHHDGQRL
jgi:hypothetical protein